MTCVGSAIAILVVLQGVLLYSAFAFCKLLDILSSEQYSIYFVLESAE